MPQDCEKSVFKIKEMRVENSRKGEKEVPYMWPIPGQRKREQVGLKRRVECRETEGESRRKGDRKKEF